MRHRAFCVMAHGVLMQIAEIVKNMTSLEISELTGKAHAHVMRDIRGMLTALLQNPDLDFVCHTSTYTGANGQEYDQYELDKDSCLTLLLGYDPVARMKVVKRWQELEARTVQAIPNFNNPAEAARAWALAYEAQQLAEATKAQIGHKREATAMNTASQAVKKANKLEIELDRAKEYASIKRMEMLYHGIQFSWRLLKSAAADLGIPSVDVFDANYGTVKAYHASVWREAYALDIGGAQ